MKKIILILMVAVSMFTACKKAPMSPPNASTGHVISQGPNGDTLRYVVKFIGQNFGGTSSSYVTINGGPHIVLKNITSGAGYVPAAIYDTIVAHRGDLIKYQVIDNSWNTAWGEVAKTSIEYDNGLIADDRTIVYNDSTNYAIHTFTIN